MTRRRVARAFAPVMGLFSLLLAAHCSSGDEPKKKNAAADASTTPTATSTTTSPTPTNYGPPSDGGVPITAKDAGPTTGSCPAGKLCLDVSPMRPGTKPMAGRLAVMWAQLNRQGPDPVAEIGYDVPFLGTETSVELPLAQITPPSEANFMCQRSCDDESVCPCINEPKVAVGYAVIVVDENFNGKADVGGAQIDSEPFVGVGAVGIAYSALEFKPAPAVEYDTAVTFAMLFTQGIEKGTAAYSLTPSFGGTADVMAAAATGNTRFKFPICDTIDQDVCVASWPTFP